MPDNGNWNFHEKRVREKRAGQALINIVQTS